MSTSGQPYDRNTPIILDRANKTPKMEDLIRQLRAFEQLEPDWNSYGAMPVSHDAVDLAIDILTRVSVMVGIQPDFVAPIGNGGVQLEWTGATAEIAVRVHPDKTLAYLLIVGDQHIEKHGVMLGEIVTAVSENVTV